MNALKPWYLSKTVWASTITIAAGIGGMLGLPLRGFDANAAADLLLQAITAISGIVALAGRVTATARIG